MARNEVLLRAPEYVAIDDAEEVIARHCRRVMVQQGAEVIVVDSQGLRIDGDNEWAGGLRTRGPVEQLLSARARPRMTSQPSQSIGAGHAVAAIGWLSAHLAGEAGAWDGNAPGWFPEPPEWLSLWERALAETEGHRMTMQPGT